MSFVHLHTHSSYSLLDGLSPVEHIPAAAADMGMPAVALTDHGNLHGVVPFCRAAMKAGIRPIIGMEAYVAPDAKSIRAQTPSHLILLAENETGYRNLVRLSTRAYLEGFHQKPCINRTMLSEHAEGLICLSGCLSSELARSILAGDGEGADSTLRFYASLFGTERYYLELQPHAIPAQQQYNAALIDLAASHGLRTVATNDSHYLEASHAQAHEVLLCVGTGSKLSDPKHFHFDGDGYHLRSPEEMQEQFSGMAGALEATLEIAERCSFELSGGNWILPDFPTPDGRAPEAYLRELVYQALPARYAHLTEDVLARVEYELDVIVTKGYATYFLIVADFIGWARQQGIAVGPGRGSAAGSIVSYLLGITGLDPLFYKLPFERFLNKERPSGPDIDVDFSDLRRDEVIAYVAGRYGADRVARICTFGTMGGRGAIRDVARVLEVPYTVADRMAKLVPSGASLDGLDEALLDGTDDADGGNRLGEVLTLAQQLEGTARHVSMHACGVVIGDKPLVEYLPLMRDRASGGLLTQFDYNGVESTGLLKIDFLGLIALTVIEQTVAGIRRRDPDFRLEAIPLDDAATFANLANGDTTGAFQLESAPMRQHLRTLKPGTIFDIMAMVALYRPGPMDHIPTFIERKHDPSRVAYLDPRMEPILARSYGVVTYQDDVLLIAIELAGFSWAEADALRKAMGKKIPAEMEKQREKLISGLLANGADYAMTEAKARQIWQLIEPFAGYGFNKAHAACYGFLGYQTAYLKTHYAAEFFAAFMDANRDNALKIAQAVHECRRLSVTVLPPDVNQSSGAFTVDPVRNAVHYGLAALRNVGEGFAQAIAAARSDGPPFRTVSDFLQRIAKASPTATALEALVKAGALDDLLGAYAGRGALMADLDRLLSAARRDEEYVQAGQTSLFGDEFSASVTSVASGGEPDAAAQRQAWEIEAFGFSLAAAGGDAGNLPDRATAIGSVSSLEDDGVGIRIYGAVTDRQEITTRSGKRMARLRVQDGSGTVSVIVFPATYERLTCKTGETVMLSGVVHATDDDNWELHATLDAPRLTPAATPAVELHVELTIPATLDEDGGVTKIEQLLALLFEAGERDTFSLRLPGGQQLSHANARTTWSHTLEIDMAGLYDGELAVSVMPLQTTLVAA